MVTAVTVSPLGGQPPNVHLHPRFHQSSQELGKWHVGMLARDALNPPAPDSSRPRLRAVEVRDRSSHGRCSSCSTPVPASPCPVPTRPWTATSMTVRTGSTTALISTEALIGTGLSLASAVHVARPAARGANCGGPGQTEITFEVAQQGPAVVSTVDCYLTVVVSRWPEPERPLTANPRAHRGRPSPLPAGHRWRRTHGRASPRTGRRTRSDRSGR